MQPGVIRDLVTGKTLSVIDVDGKSEEEIRLSLRESQWNGPYATKVCSRCGVFWSNEDGNWRTAKITKRCTSCITEDELNEEGKG